MGGAGGGRGVWGYVEGGMGALSDALRRGADAAGVTVRVDAPVAQIETVGGRAVAVRLVSGARITARQIVSPATPAVTFLQLIADRTSIVEGKSVYIGVDHGGRRIHKNNRKER